MSSATQEITRILWNPKVQHRNLPPVPILSQIDSISPPSNLSKIHFNIIFPYTQLRLNDIYVVIFGDLVKAVWSGFKFRMFIQV
jgi:hypothetical protein